MADEKVIIIAQLINKYDIQSAKDIQKALAGMVEHLRYEEYQHSDNSNSHNGKNSKSMITDQMSQQIEDIYGFEVSKELISNITDKLLPQIEEWQQRPLFSIYHVIFIDTIHFSIRDNEIIKKKEVLIIEIGKKSMIKPYNIKILN